MRTLRLSLLTVTALGFGLAPTALAQGSDDCATATPISGTGLFPFSNIGATNSGTTGLNCTGTAGAGADTMPDDVWFLWTCPANGSYRIQTCGTSPVLDSKLAVFDGPNCGALNQVDCSEDEPGCANFSSVCFLPGAIGGNTYLIELGAWPARTVASAPGPKGRAAWTSTSERRSVAP